MWGKSYFNVAPWVQQKRCLHSYQVPLYACSDSPTVVALARGLHLRPLDSLPLSSTNKSRFRIITHPRYSFPNLTHTWRLRVLTCLFFLRQRLSALCTFPTCGVALSTPEGRIKRPSVRCLGFVFRLVSQTDFHCNQ